MAISPRNELVIESVVIFGHFPDGWVWAERSPDGSTEIDSADRSFTSLSEAGVDFFNDRGINLDTPVAAEEARYSCLIMAADDEFHIRKYRYGAPDPIQVVK